MRRLALLLLLPACSTAPRELPDLVDHPDELYHRLVHMHDAPYRLLATAFSDPETGGTGAHEPRTEDLYAAGLVDQVVLDAVERAAQAAVDSLSIHSGADWAESDIPALYATATGEGLGTYLPEQTACEAALAAFAQSSQSLLVDLLR